MKDEIKIVSGRKCAFRTAVSSVTSIVIDKTITYSLPFMQPDA
jgi:hypothetical protein